ncbi:histidine kinase N-terminal 7TM domain-containing protein [Halovivax gelatinilyticus]|uniref:histidine kinase N-terminal 7TM domain-containing protein n=1 Tax=Halovivax gelatinilyticus TaxID=2961597 RepID=UPI0020CA9B95|nr:histidine kinase N-terminal 7TM domain-containing protein [Halovivax gelatinilyticus]
MSSVAQSLAFVMVICAVPIAGVAVFTYRNLAKPGARGFLLCVIGMAGWSIMLALITWPAQFTSVTVNTTLRHAFQLLVIFGWPLFVWEYTRRERISVPRPSFVALLAIPVATVVLTATNSLHHLVLAAETPSNPAGIGEFVLGPWYLIHIGFAVVMVMVPAGVLAQDLRSAVDDHRRQLLLLLAGWAIGFPGALNTHLFRTVDAVPSYVDLTPALFLLTTALWGLALFRYRLFGLAPVSRRQAVEHMSDAVISVDRDGLIVDANPSAGRYFDRSTNVLGTPFADRCGHHPALLAAAEVGHGTGIDVTVDADGETHHLVVDVRPIEHGHTVSGTLLVIRDVTDQRARERDLDLLKQVLSRVFRHNIRTELTVIGGHAELIGDRSNDPAIDDSLRTIEEYTERILGHSEKAKDLERVLDAGDEHSVAIDRVVERRVAAMADGHPNARFEVDVDALTVSVHPGLDLAIEELLTNAVVHNDAPTPTVAIRTDATGETVRLVVADDGPGIDAHELAPIEAGTESDLEHGSGIGLWLVRLVANRSGGTLTIGRDDELGGTRVELSLTVTDD